jgi:hypothetical protein
MFNVHMWAGLREGSPVLGGLLLQAIWRLGLPIWDLRRMRGLGLATDLIIEGGELSTEPLVRSKATVAFTWFSILGFSGKERTHSPSLPDADNSIVSI